MVSNQGKITTLAADASVNKGLVDGTDKLHSGIIKVLESFAQGDMCIGHAGFTITDGGTYTQYNLAQPIEFFAKGQYVNYTSGNLTVAYSSTVQDASNSRYDWVLLNPNIGGTPSIVIVQGTAGTTPLVSDITAGYIPIALVHISAGTDNDKFDYSFQTYTMNVAKNSLSIGYDDSGYTEAMSIVATADRTTFKNKVANADIRFILADNTADEKFEILSDDDSDGDEGDTTVFSVNGLGATSISGTVNLGSVANAGTDTDKFLVLDSAGNVDFRTGTEVVSDIGALTTESDTLATVTGRGNTTTNSITCANVTATAGLVGDTATIATALTNNGVLKHRGEAFSGTLGGGVPPVPSFTTSIIYIHDATGNALVLPDPAAVANTVFTIRNLGTATTAITSANGRIDDVPTIPGYSGTNHRLVSTPNQIDLPVGDVVVVHAVSDGNPAPLQDSYFIISP